MLPAEFFRVLLFLSLVGMVFGTAFLFAADLIRRWGKPAPPSRLYRRCRAAAFGSAGLGIGCLLYGYFVEPYWLEVARVRLTSGKLSPGASLRIAHVSDLHCDPKVRLERKLPAAIAAEKPDLIVFTGDAVNSPEGLPTFKAFLSEVSGVAPTYVVRGNWDAWFWRDLDLFGGTGARELGVETVSLTVRGTAVTISGVPVTRKREIERLLRAAPPGAFNLFLYHYPDEIETAARGPVDLYCAGHTHGGQVALPFYGALVTLSRFGKRFEAGLYRVRDTWLYVNRGIGMEGGAAPRVRFAARPELTIIDVSGVDPGAGP